MAEAIALHKKEATTYAGLRAEAETDIAAIANAVATLEQGMAESVLQTPAAQVLRRVATQPDMPESDQQEVAVVLSQASDDAPQSGNRTMARTVMGGL